MNMTPRTLDLPNLDAVVADVHHLHQQGYTCAGKWDLTQTCQHLTLLLNLCLDGTDLRVPVAFRVMAKLLGIKGRILRTRSIRAGLPAPSQAVFSPAVDQADEAQAVEDLAQAAQRVQQYEGVYRPHPIFGCIRRDEWLDFHAIHAAHHLRMLVPTENSS